MDTVTICLSHKYPACQANPQFLKGGDQLLYELLRGAVSDVAVGAAGPAAKYVLSVVPVDIVRSDDQESAAMFGATIYDIRPCDGTGSSSDTAATDKTSTGKVVAPFQPSEDLVHSRTDYIEYTGNEAQPEEVSYKLSGLRIRLRK